MNTAGRPLKIVAAALLERDGRVLVTRRPDGTHLAGYWEFPGGKLEAGESPEACLAREMLEELDLPVEVGSVYEVVFHPYEAFDLLMLVYRCRAVSGEPRPLGCSELRWARPAELEGLEFPPADTPVVARILAEGL